MEFPLKRFSVLLDTYTINAEKRRIDVKPGLYGASSGGPAYERETLKTVMMQPLRVLQAAFTIKYALY